jgi:N-acetylglucosamine kinase-like BadF-type ATPase
VVIAGTGSIAFGRDRQGRTARAGGWGFAIGDEGSAHWIGRAAVKALLRASDASDASNESDESDEVASSPLAAALFKAWGVRSLSDLAHAGNSIPPPDFSTLLPAVLASEDDLAAEVLRAAGTELAGIVMVIVGRLFPKAEYTIVPVAMIGGVFRHAELVRQVFYNELRRLDERVEVQPQVIAPVEGALRMARRAALTESENVGRISTR